MQPLENSFKKYMANNCRRYFSVHLADKVNSLCKGNVVSILNVFNREVFSDSRLVSSFPVVC